MIPSWGWNSDQLVTLALQTRLIRGVYGASESYAGKTHRPVEQWTHQAAQAARAASEGLGNVTVGLGNLLSWKCYRILLPFIFFSKICCLENKMDACNWKWKTAMWKEDLLLQKTWLNSSIMDDAVNMWGLLALLSAHRPWLWPAARSTASARFTLVSSTAVHMPPSTSTKGALSVLYWNIAEMQTAHTGYFLCCCRFLPGKHENSSLTFPLVCKFCNQGREHIRYGLHQH